MKLSLAAACLFAVSLTTSLRADNARFDLEGPKIDRQADEKGIVPECGEDGSRLHFLQWYEKWLDEGISRFRDENTK